MIGDRWSVVSARLAAEAAGMHTAMGDRAEGFAQDDGRRRRECIMNCVNC